MTALIDRKTVDRGRAYGCARHLTCIHAISALPDSGRRNCRLAGTRSVAASDPNCRIRIGARGGYRRLCRKRKTKPYPWKRCASIRPKDSDARAFEHPHAQPMATRQPHRLPGCLQRKASTSVIAAAESVRFCATRSDRQRDLPPASCAPVHAAIVRPCCSALLAQLVARLG